MTTPATRRRRGFTLVELLLGLALTGVVFAAVVPFLIRQSRSTSGSSGRLDANQTARFAQDAIDRDLRMLGAGTLDEQPMLVQADRFAVTFNADLTTRDVNDGWAIYYDPDADAGSVVAMQPAQKRLLPRSSFGYPDTTYVDQGAPGRAETISYWLQPDLQTGRADEYVLWRRVNADDSSRVASAIYVPPGESFFTYSYADTTGKVIDSLPVGNLPLYHTARTHGGTADSGATATQTSLIDRVRGVRVNALGSSKVRDADTTVKRLARGATTLVNVTMLRRTSCGLAPAAAGNVKVKVNGSNSNPTSITVTWSASSDESAGEHDVERYLIYRSRNGAALTDPIADVPAGSTNGNYSYDDFDVKQTAPTVQKTWTYSVVAQDCQPQSSAFSSAITPLLPTSP